MKIAVTSAPSAAERVIVQIEGLAGNAPLNGQAFGRKFFVFSNQCLVNMPIERKILIKTPTCRTMVHNYLPYWVAAQRVVTPLQFAAAKAHISHDDIVSVDLRRFTSNANAIAGRGLTCNRDERMIDREPIRQRNDSGHAKYDDPRLRCRESFAQTPRPAVSQSCYFINPSPAPAGSDRARAFRTGKCGHFGGRTPPDARCTGRPKPKDQSPKQK